MRYYFLWWLKVLWHVLRLFLYPLCAIMLFLVLAIYLIILIPFYPYLKESNGYFGVGKIGVCIGYLIGTAIEGD